MPFPRSDGLELSHVFCRCLVDLLLALVRSDEPVLWLRGCHALALLTSKAPERCPQPKAFLSSRKAILVKSGGIRALLGNALLACKKWRLLKGV